MTQGDRKGHSVQNFKSTHFKAKIDCQSHKQTKGFCSMKNSMDKTIWWDERRYLKLTSGKKKKKETDLW